MSLFDDSPSAPETVQLNSASLLSKWGFGDGDDLNWLFEFGDFDKHATLVELVRRKLLPILDQKVEIEVINTCHNPCRARTVDGENVTKWHYELNPPIKLTPKWVIVSGADVLNLAQELAREGSAHDSEIVK